MVLFSWKIKTRKRTHCGKGKNWKTFIVLSIPKTGKSFDTRPYESGASPQLVLRQDECGPTPVCVRTIAFFLFYKHKLILSSL